MALQSESCSCESGIPSMIPSSLSARVVNLLVGV